MDHGGRVIVVITWVILIMWTIIIERLLYLRTVHPYRVRHIIAGLRSRVDRGSWAFEAIRQSAISQLSQRLNAGIPMIQTLAAICPLLGLLGTVTGMIVIFDVMATMGNSSPRAVAAGVAQATLTTMAGMVGALSGVFPAAFLSRRATEEISGLNNDHGLLLERPEPAAPRLRLTTRLPVAIVLSSLVTAVLVYGMQRLIETGERALTDDQSIYIADFVRVQRDETVEQKERKPDRLPPPDTAPETTVTPEQTDTGMGSVQVNFNAGRLDQGLDLNISGVSDYSNVDGDYLPLVKVAPIYPRRAQVLGMSGRVLLRFTVTALGTVKDVEIVESTNSIFNNAAVQAALKFKYRPRVVNGEAVEVTGVLHSIVFEIEE